MTPTAVPFSSAEAFLAAHPAVRGIDLLLPDMNGILRGKRIEVGDLRTVYDKGMLLPGSMFALDALGGTVEATGLGFDEGDADRPCLPVADGLQPCAWLGDDMAQLQVQMFEHGGEPFFGDPRHALGAIVDRFRARGLNPVVAVELEFYFVDCQRTPEGNAQPPRSPLTGRREHRTQINSMIDLDSVSPILREIGISPLEVFGTILVLLAIPATLGMAAAHRHPAFAARARRPFRILSITAFAGFVVLALAANWEFFLQYTGRVVVAVLLLNALGLGIGYVAARLAGLAPADRRAVSIEVGVQNSGLGLILVFNFFGGLGGMAVVAAWWGIWHIVSGLSLASWWRRHPPVPVGKQGPPA